METWAIIVLVLGTNAVSALLTFLITRMQVSSSAKRLDKQLQSAREADSKQWRRKVRSEPLLKLSHELAQMAAKQDRMVTALRKHRNAIGSPTEEEARKELQEVKDDWDTYMKSGVLKQTSLLQYDKELVRKVHGVIDAYSTSYDAVIQNKELGAEETWPEVIEVQELINKLREEL